MSHGRGKPPDRRPDAEQRKNPPPACYRCRGLAYPHVPSSACYRCIMYWRRTGQAPPEYLIDSGG